jgi:hypothetical protein
VINSIKQDQESNLLENKRLSDTIVKLEVRETERKGIEKEVEQLREREK